jgi:RNA polymerase sigma factor (sigma-70 family)
VALNLSLPQRGRRQRARIFLVVRQAYIDRGERQSAADKCTGPHSKTQQGREVNPITPSSYSLTTRMWLGNENLWPKLRLYERLSKWSLHLGRRESTWQHKAQQTRWDWSIPHCSMSSSHRTLAYRITRNREDAEDAMQDAFLQAFSHFEEFDGRSKFATWLTRIAINSALMILRKRKSDRIVSLDGDSNFEEWNTFQEPRDSAPDAEQQYLRKEREATLRDAINRLRPSLRGVVEVAQIGERSIRESADIIGLSLAATKGRLFHARANLRSSLRRFCNDCPSRSRYSISKARADLSLCSHKLTPSCRCLLSDFARSSEQNRDPDRRRP